MIEVRYICWSFQALAKAPARSLEQHCWLDGIAYRAVAIDPHGRMLAIESFDPGFTEAEELAKAGVKVVVWPEAAMRSTSPAGSTVAKRADNCARCCSGASPPLSPAARRSS